MPDTSDPYTVTINTDNLDNARVQTVYFRNSIQYEDQSFDPYITFDIEFLHPCRRTTFNSVTIGTISYQLHDATDLDTEIDIPSDVASTLYSDGWATCGARTYAIVDSTGATPTWVTAVSDMADG